MENTISTKQYKYIFYALVVLLVIDRISHLYLFSFKYADGDQTILWLGTIEMLQGHFHEPAFYGQSYNTFFEGIIALPLVALGVPVYKALPIVTALLATFPFVLFAFLVKEKNKIAALIFLAIPLLLPSEYIMLTQLPRGFVTGIFGASISVAVLLFGKENTKSHYLLSGIVGGFSLVLNPNSVLLLLPVYLYVFIKTEKKISMVLCSFLGIIPALVWLVYVSWFYTQHPNYIVHSLHYKSFSIDNFLQAISHFHELFYHLFPFVLFAGVAIIPTMLFIAYKLNKKGEKTFALTLVVTVVFVFITFFSSKITDGTASIFFPYSRMFLGLPIVVGIGLYFLFKGIEIKTKPLLWFLGITLVFVVIKLSNINGRGEWNWYNNSGFVKIFKVEELKQDYTQIQHIADSLGVEMLIINEKNDILNYSTMALSNSRLKTISLSYERKGWLVEDEWRKVSFSKPFLFWCEDVLNTKDLEVKRVSDKFPLYKATTPENSVVFFNELRKRNKQKTKNN